MRDPLSNRSLLLAGVALLSLPLAACNTVEGAGEDIQSIGEAVDEGADEAGDEWDEDGDWD
jgi:predicted small secreted protein